jgi:uncharacterized protein
MTQLRPKSTVTSVSGRSVPSEDRSRLQAELSRAKGQMEPGEICAYNQTRESFIGMHVAAGDFSPASLSDRMATLKPNSGAGMWMAPFRGIPAAEVRVPVDLLYLDEACQVIEAVEFFPTFQVSPSSSSAASVLAVPTHSIFSSHTQPGDQLMLCTADELEWRLERLGGAPALGGGRHSAPASPALGPVLVRGGRKEPAGPAPLREEPDRTIDPAPVALVREEPKAAAALPEPQQPPTQKPEQQHPAKQPGTRHEKPWMDPARRPAKSPLGRLGSWLFPGSADPRNKARLPVDGLVAHFFTGGAPQAHEIRDVSPTGFYVVTAERWYPGTVIRMTLTKPGKGQQSAKRSITVHARSVRWGNDGVGLEFVPEAPKSRHGQRTPLDGADSELLGHFLKHLGDGSL